MAGQGGDDGKALGWLVRAPAAYRIDAIDADTFAVTIRAGSTRHNGRRLGLPRAQVEANLSLGDLAFTRVKPAWVADLPPAEAEALAGATPNGAAVPKRRARG